MNQKRAIHPSPETLTAFVNGRLADEELADVEEHVLNCERCVDFLRTVPEDDLIEQIRTSDTSAWGSGTRMMSAKGDDDSGNTRFESGSMENLAELADHPRYRIIKQLGAGGMGVVYQAEHRVMERTVAIKVITPNLVSNCSAVERFHQEVKAAARLSHKNIVTAYDAEQTGSLHYLVMEYVEGESLDQIVQKHGPLPVPRACYYIVQAALGLEHASEHGMVHRDIKPQNLMCTETGIVKILDFGLARLAVPDDDKTGLTAFGTTVGTPDYIAPEQARDSRSVDVRADIYSLGCTFYFLLTGETLFPDGGAMEKVVAHMEREPPSIADIRPDIPADVVAVLDRMLHKDPGHRFQTPKEIADALKPSIKPGSKVSAKANQPGEPAYVYIIADDRPIRPKPRSKKNQNIAIWAGLGGVVFLSLLLWLVLRDTGPDAEWIDLLGRIDRENFITGTWEKTDRGLVVDNATAATLVLPTEIPAEYDLEVTFTRRSGEHSVALFFVVGTGRATFEVDAWDDGLAGIQSVHGQTLENAPSAKRLSVVNGTPTTMLLKVRRGRVEGIVGDKTVAVYEGDGSDLSVVAPWNWTQENKLGLGAYQSSFAFHQIRLRPVKSE